VAGQLKQQVRPHPEGFEARRQVAHFRRTGQWRLLAGIAIGGTANRDECVLDEPKPEEVKQRQQAVSSPSRCCIQVAPPSPRGPRRAAGGGSGAGVIHAAGRLSTTLT
jgi:hypothetical protein